MKKNTRAYIIRPLFTATIAAAIILALSCSSDIELPPPPPPDTLSSSSLPDPVASSSSSLPANTVLCLHNGSCNAVSNATCSAIGGQIVQTCPEVSSSSLRSSSSSWLSSSSSKLSSSSIVASSSSVALISSSAVSSSSSLTVAPSSSSSSVKPSSSSSVVVSSSSRPSSSSVVLSSSSSISSGVVYGPSVNYEGETYETVVIGTQTWFKRNLNYNASGSKCYNNSTTNCTEYGRLYNWATAMGLDATCNSNTCASQIQTKHKGICPQGWHIPSDADWNTLMKFVNPSCSDNINCAGAGTKLKVTSGWNSSGGSVGTDDYGFSAPAGGYGDSGGSFYYVRNNGFWWSTCEYNSSNAYRRYMVYTSGNVNWSNVDKSSLYSIRCLQD